MPAASAALVRSCIGSLLHERRPPQWRWRPKQTILDRLGTRSEHVLHVMFSLGVWLRPCCWPTRDVELAESCKVFEFGPQGLPDENLVRLAWPGGPIELRRCVFMLRVCCGEGINVEESRDLIEQRDLIFDDIFEAKKQ